MSWRDRVFHNPGLKLVSIGLASLVWFAVYGRHQVLVSPAAATKGATVATVKDYVRLPITVMQSAGEGHAYDVQPAQVSVRVSGDQAILQELRGSDLEVFVNLADLGDRRSAARRVKILAPAGVRILRVEPALVHIERLSLDLLSTNQPPDP